jgi:1-acyl-sn-glycerol-3-phosphate acyltransferase
MAEGDVYLTGRAKEVIIRAGRNLYPYELEEAVGAVPGVRKGCVAAFGATDPATGTERLVVVAETRESDPARIEALHATIHHLAMDLLHTAPDEIVLAPPHTVLKTSSGKIRRAACRELYERGALGTARRAVWVQFARMTLSGLLARSRRAAHDLMRALYAGYAWTVFGAGISAAWACALLLPSPAGRQRAVGALARGFFGLAGIPIRVRRAEGVSTGGPVIFAANHASYLDAVVLSAVLPPGGGFVAKRELAGAAIARALLRRLGSVFVERVDPKRSAEDARGWSTPCTGASLVVFPEGRSAARRVSGRSAWGRSSSPPRRERLSSGRDPGDALDPARRLLVPRRSAISVAIGEPLRPKGADWSAALALQRRGARRDLESCGEPDLEPSAPGSV